MREQVPLEHLIDVVQDAAYSGIVEINFNGDHWDVRWYEELEPDGVAIREAPDGTGDEWHRWRWSECYQSDLRRQLEATVHLIRTGKDDWDGGDE